MSAPTDIKTVEGTVVSAEYPEGEHDFITIRVPTGHSWGFEPVTIIRGHDVIVVGAGRFMPRGAA